ncbi:MAG: chorismate mutase [Nitrososphaeria archaeon]|nr:chorismate mutase [Nitrososphaeria archaeon]
MSEEIEVIREKINYIDEEIIKLLAERVKAAKYIGRLKKEKGLPVIDSRREIEVYKRIKNLAAKNGLNPEDCEKIFKEIILMCRKVQ